MDRHSINRLNSFNLIQSNWLYVKIGKTVQNKKPQTTVDALSSVWMVHNLIDHKKKYVFYFSKFYIMKLLIWTIDHQRYVPLCSDWDRYLAQSQLS